MTIDELPDDLHVDSSRGGWVRRYGGAIQSPMHRAHRHDELEANLVLRGWVDYLIGDRRVRFPRQTLGWLLPHEKHRLIQSSPDVQMWIMVFSPALVGELDRDDAGPPRRWLRIDADAGQGRVVGEHAGELDRLCALLSDPAEPAVRHRLGLAWLLSECWRAFSQSPGAPAGIPLHPAVQAAARWLHDHAAEAEADDLLALARRCGISRPWLSRLFNEQLGESLTDYRNRQRFYRFRDLLAQPDVDSTTAAALAAGFGSYTQCFRIVRQHTGISPRALARRVGDSSV